MQGKVVCLNPNSGTSMKIDEHVYHMFNKAIRHALKGGQNLTYTELVRKVEEQFSKGKAGFKGSVGWYTVAVKNDMQSRSEIDVYTEKGRKLHKLKG